MNTRARGRLVKLKISIILVSSVLRLRNTRCPTRSCPPSPRRSSSGARGRRPRGLSAPRLLSPLRRCVYRVILISCPTENQVDRKMPPRTVKSFPMGSLTHNVLFSDAARQEEGSVPARREVREAVPRKGARRAQAQERGQEEQWVSRLVGGMIYKNG